MKKFNVLSINFDTKVKIVMTICIIIATIIISYSFYNICLKNGIKSEKISLVDINDFLSINCYDAEYEITVNSNKNSNTYNVKESTDMENGKYNYVIDNNLYIQINKDEIRLKKENIEYEYVTTLLNNPNNNFISFSTVIEIIRKIQNNSISGNIKRTDSDDNVVYKVTMEDEYIKNISQIEIHLSKSQNKIMFLNMFNKDKKEQYSISFVNFTVKK